MGAECAQKVSVVFQIGYEYKPHVFTDTRVAQLVCDQLSEKDWGWCVCETPLDPDMPKAELPRRLDFDKLEEYLLKVKEYDAELANKIVEILGWGEEQPIYFVSVEYDGYFTRTAFSTKEKAEAAMNELARIRGSEEDLAEFGVSAIPVDDRNAWLDVLQWQVEG